MPIKQIIKRLRETKVLENYSFMTALQICTVLISLIVYPYVIRVVGKENYGIWVYALTIATYFQVFIDYGFELPCAKAVVLAKDDRKKREFLLSAIFSAKTYMWLIGCILIGILYFFIPFIHDNIWICVVAYIQIYALSIFPTWYFQAMKNMKVVTYINLTCKTLSVPLIYLLVKNQENIFTYALILTILYMFSSLSAYAFLRHEKLKIKLVGIKEILPFYKESTPFFVCDLAGNLKNALLKTTIKNLFGLSEVAVYDLAEKIINILQIFTNNINRALFPEVIDKATPQKVRRIANYERIIGIAVVAFVCIFGKPIVLLLGGSNMIDAYPIAMVLSLTTYAYMIVRVYLNFVFIAQNKYRNITYNQFVALLSCGIFLAVGIAICRNILMVAAAISLSGFTEIIYCKYVCWKQGYIIDDKKKK